MKEIDLNGITFLRPVREGTSEWYYAMDYDNGDLYELQELYHFENGTSFEGNRLYFNRWFEDPFFREETVIRDKDSGQILEVLSGDVHIMPNGEMWHLK